MLTRRSFLASSIAGALVALSSRRALALPMAKPRSLTVYKDPSCGCCSKWVEYMRGKGWDVRAIDNSDMDALKDHYGVPSAVRSCHTAVVDRYLIEGHVPAEDIDHLLAKQPKVLGLAVPGMVVGSPGMEGGSPSHFDVVSFQKTGATQTFASH